jgi:DNA-binding transcriptional LysR family regulator
MEHSDAEDLLIFARVADAGSFSRAAQRLGLPKSTVSRRLAGLEARLGERLLLRTTRSLRLTEFGAQLLAHARQLAAEVDAAQALAAHRQARPSGRLRVSMPSDFANLLLTDMLAAFVALHPAVALELDVSPRRVDLLAEGFDLALRVGDLPDDSLLAARRIACFGGGLYAAPAYLAERGDPAGPDALMQHDALQLLGRDGAPVAWKLVPGARQAASAAQTHRRDSPVPDWHGTPPGRAVANSPELLVRLACAGAGIAAVPHHFCAPAVRRGELRRVLPDWQLPEITAWAVFPGRHLMPAKTRAFIDMLDAALGDAAVRS